jgi:hypothetical protein
MSVRLVLMMLGGCSCHLHHDSFWFYIYRAYLFFSDQLVLILRFCAMTFLLYIQDNSTELVTYLLSFRYAVVPSPSLPYSGALRDSCPELFTVVLPSVYVAV